MLLVVSVLFAATAGLGAVLRLNQTASISYQQEADFWPGSYITRDGIRTGLKEGDIQAQIVDIKTKWDNQWNPGLLSYYEGAVDVDGTIKGVGFMELTGYPRVE